MRAIPKTWVPVLLAAFLLVTAAGCDTNEPTESDFQMLRGDWVVTRLTADGDGLTNLMEARYEGGVVMVFLENNNTGQRSFRLVGSSQNDEQDLDTEGPIDLNSDNSFFVTSDRLGDVLLTYRFEGSNRVVLTAPRPYGQAVLEALTGSENMDAVAELTLERDD